MIKQITFSDFIDSFPDQYENTFTYEGKRALFDYLEEYGQSTGQSIELDTVALCCEYTEYSDFEEIKSNYPDLKDMEDLEDHTTVIPFAGGIIIQDY